MEKTGEKKQQLDQQESKTTRDEQEIEDSVEIEVNNITQKENVDIIGKKLDKEIFRNNGGKLTRIDFSDPTNRTEIQKERYDEKDMRPFNIIIRISREYINVKKEKNNIKIWKILMRHNTIPEEMKMISHGTAIWTFEHFIDANRCLEELKKDKEIQASIDSKKATYKGVIADWPDSIPELWEAIEDQDSIVKLERIYSRKWVTQEKRLVEIKTENIIVTFKGDTIKENIILWNDRIRLKGKEGDTEESYDRYEKPNRWPKIQSRGKTMISSPRQHESRDNKNTSGRADKEMEQGPNRASTFQRETEKEKERNQIIGRLREEKRVRIIKRGKRTETQEEDTTDGSSREMSEEEDIREIAPTELKSKKDQELRDMMRKMMMVMYKRNEDEKEYSGPKRTLNKEKAQRIKEREITRNIKSRFWKKQRGSDDKQQIN
ncbi:hypothetical protein PV326_010400 [Microctonus aethiopoides]|nr:hypothetical protein PV326_010400 [Microctonus aethiopoides]